MSNDKERRKHKRIRKPYMVRLRIKHHEGLKTSSAGGALCSYNKHLEIGTLLDLKIDVSTSTPAINCVERVTRIEQSQPPSTLHFAMEFEDIGEQAKELISKIAEEVIEQKAKLL